jgi:hypothetical protein
MRCGNEKPSNYPSLEANCHTYHTAIPNSDAIEKKCIAFSLVSLGDWYAGMQVRQIESNSTALLNFSVPHLSEMSRAQ